MIRAAMGILQRRHFPASSIEWRARRTRTGRTMLMTGHVPGLLSMFVAILSATGQPATRDMSTNAGAPARGSAEFEFVFETAPFASAHASTIVETREGLVTAWFAGTREGAADVGIWLSRHVAGRWTPPIEVATGTQPDGMRYPCWNPVLFEVPRNGLMLFYKVGPSPQRWWGLVANLSRQRADLDRPATPAGRDPGPHQEQARPASRRNDRGPEQHRVAVNLRAHGECTSSARSTTG